MSNDTKFYIDAQWVEPVTPRLFNVINPATEDVAGQISLGSDADVDRAVPAARRAFASFSQTGKEQRIALLQKIIERYEARFEELARAMTLEMGSPITFSREVQATNALGHFKQAVTVLEAYELERFMGGTLIRREPIGVCGLITPWNWPLNQITSKVAPALAAGCTVVLKASEVAPLSAILLAEILHDAGVPKGVFNLVNGDGPTVGEAISRHPDIDMVSFTGSTRAGILVAKAAADTVSAWLRSWGANPRTSFCRMPTSTRQCLRACCAHLPTPDSRARRRPACWFIARNWMRPWRWPNAPPRPCGSVTRSIPPPRWGRWSARRSTTRSRG
jgi:aldehyde dehydrogenase (NAD+)